MAASARNDPRPPARAHAPYRFRTPTAPTHGAPHYESALCALAPRWQRPKEPRPPAAVNFFSKKLMN